MSQIDWSKAPEGAEVHFPNQAGTAECFAIFREDGAYYAYPGMTEWTRWSCGSKDSLLSRFKHSFKEWNGEGLPPVGTVCEVQHPDKPETWCKCTILVWDSECAVFSTDANYPFAYDGNGYPESFRPIRTTEQIAAEERKAGIAEIFRDLVELPWHNERMAEGLYDAGYRKQAQ